MAAQQIVQRIPIIVQRTYNGGCFLNTNCIESCFQEVYGYSEECSSCFGKIPQCSINSGCMMVWYVSCSVMHILVLLCYIVCCFAWSDLPHLFSNRYDSLA